MNDINEKYLSRVLESASEGLVQATAALEQLKEQTASVTAQREEMEDAVKELKDLLGITEEETSEEGD